MKAETIIRVSVNEGVGIYLSYVDKKGRPLKTYHRQEDVSRQLRVPCQAVRSKSHPSEGHGGARIPFSEGPSRPHLLRPLKDTPRRP